MSAFCMFAQGLSVCMQREGGKSGCEETRMSAHCLNIVLASVHRQALHWPRDREEPRVGRTQARLVARNQAATFRVASPRHLTTVHHGLSSDPFWVVPSNDSS